jgi:hypothetical protein
MDNTLHNRALAFLDGLEHQSATTQHDAFINETLETHGRFDPPTGDRTHLWELELHGVSAEGLTEEEAIANWKRLAGYQFPIEEADADNFVTVYASPQQPAAQTA